MAVRPIDGNALIEWFCPYLHSDEPIPADVVIEDIRSMPTLTQPNESLTWEELTAETKINPVYSMKYGWIFPSTVKDEPYKQVWFFTSKGFANTELFHRDTFYRRPPEGEEKTR